MGQVIDLITGECLDNSLVTVVRTHFTTSATERWLQLTTHGHRDSYLVQNIALYSNEKISAFKK